MSKDKGTYRSENIDSLLEDFYEANTDKIKEAVLEGLAEETFMNDDFEKFVNKRWCLSDEPFDEDRIDE